MFKKAVKEHPGANSKPLQANFLRGNTTVPTQSKPAPPQSVGVKRKIEMTNSGGSNLGSLHSGVYFDENDFDDDIDLDDDEPLPFTAPKPPAPAEPDLVTYPSLGQPDITYPELPPPSQENLAPPSSNQLPWSSSPPSHYQPPPRPRKLPWQSEAKSPAQDFKKVIAPFKAEDTKNSHVTPRRKKPSDIWNKSASAIKEEQKELRREYRKTQKVEEAPKAPEDNTKSMKIFLSEEQMAVLEAVVDKGKSIFFTGSAGTGKSVLMREIIKKLRMKYKREPDRVAVTASTGLAACNIEGVTLHSFAGIGLGKEPVPELVKKVSASAKLQRIYANVLIDQEESEGAQPLATHKGSRCR